MMRLHPVQSCTFCLLNRYVKVQSCKCKRKIRHPKTQWGLNWASESIPLLTWQILFDTHLKENILGYLILFYCYIFIFRFRCLFSIAGITNYHKFSDLQQQKFTALHLCQLEVRNGLTGPRQGVGRTAILLLAPFLCWELFVSSSFLKKNAFLGL